MPDDHSEVVPLLPIPNRTVKRLSADDSADSRVKVGHCQAINRKPPSKPTEAFFFGGANTGFQILNIRRASARNAPLRHISSTRLRLHWPGSTPGKCAS